MISRALWDPRPIFDAFSILNKKFCRQPKRYWNKTNTGMAMLAGSIDAGGMPKLVHGEGPKLVDGNLLTASAPAVQAVHDALAKRHGARYKLSELLLMANLP